MFADGTTYLTDIMSVITQILSIFTEEPVIYFVMLALVGASVGIVKRLLPTKSR